MPKRLIVCSACLCHAKPIETHCPSCGARLRGSGSWTLPAAAIVAMGLSATTCGDDEGGHGADSNAGYTAARSSSRTVTTTTTTASSSGQGGDGGMQGNGAGGAAGAGGE